MKAILNQDIGQVTVTKTLNAIFLGRGMKTHLQLGLCSTFKELYDTDKENSR